MTHTPGPWHIEADGSIGRPFIIAENGSAVARISAATRWIGVDVSPEERDANARLIAAAPRLYEALQRAEFVIGYASMTPYERDALAEDIKFVEDTLESLEIDHDH